MNNVWTIFRKELKDSLRDHRTVMTMLVIPLLIIPIAVNFMGRMDVGRSDADARELLRVGIMTHGNALDFEWALRADEDIYVVRTTTEEEAHQMLQDDDLDAFVLFSRDFDSRVAEQAAGEVEILYNHFGTPTERQRLQAYLRAFEQELLSTRFASLSAPTQWAEALRMQERQITAPEEVLSRMMAGLMPYIVIIFCFLGCMYPALDLGAGEKERGTMETLLTAPASRMDIVLGKFGVVFLAGMTSAAVAILGMYLGLLPYRDVSSGLIDTMRTFFEAQNLVLEIALLVPLAMFFGAILLTVSVFSRSFKEAQSIITPLTIVAIFPAGVALIPSLELGTVTALVPVLNVSLATKTMTTGGVPLLPMLLVFVSLSVIAFGALVVCSRYFNRESVIFRT